MPPHARVSPESLGSGNSTPERQPSLNWCDVKGPKAQDTDAEAVIASAVNGYLHSLGLTPEPKCVSTLKHKADSPAQRRPSSLHAAARQDGKVLIRLAPRRSTRFLDAAIVFLVHMLPCTLLPLFFALIYWWRLHSVYGWMGTAGISTVLIIAMTVPLGYSKTFRSLFKFLYIAMARYMKEVKIVVPRETVGRPGQPHILGLHPHGRQFYTCLMMSQMHETWRAPFLPGGDMFMAASDAFFYLPFFRHLLYAAGGIPASKSAILRALRRKDNVAIQIGGVREVCLGTHPDKDELYLRNRKGFARVAIDENVGVIPVYCFNETQIFQHEPQWKMDFWKAVNQYLKIGVPVYHGILGLPMPYRRELLVAVGDPLYPREGESVDEFHERYVKALSDLFQKYVSYSANPDHKLVIL